MDFPYSIRVMCPNCKELIIPLYWGGTTFPVCPNCGYVWNVCEKPVDIVSDTSGDTKDTHNERCPKCGHYIYPSYSDGIAPSICYYCGYRNDGSDWAFGFSDQTKENDKSFPYMWLDLGQKKRLLEKIEKILDKILVLLDEK